MNDLKLKKQNLSRIISLINAAISKKDSPDENKMQSMLEDGRYKNKKKWTSHSSNLHPMRPVHKIFK